MVELGMSEQESLCFGIREMQLDSFPHCLVFKCHLKNEWQAQQ